MVWGEVDLGFYRGRTDWNDNQQDVDIEESVNPHL